MSVILVADQIRISPSCLLRWIKKLPIYHYIAENEHSDRDRFSLSAGRGSQLEEYTLIYSVSLKICMRRVLRCQER